MWSGLRPLIKAGGGKTSKLSRDHSVLVSPSGIVTVAGGKWTTYRKMGEDAINRACEVHNIRCAPSKTADMHLHGWALPDTNGPGEWQQVYGTDLPSVQSVLPASDPTARRAPQAAPAPSLALPHRAKKSSGRRAGKWRGTVEDVLARRTRALFLDARAAIGKSRRSSAPTFSQRVEPVHRCGGATATSPALQATSPQGYIYSDSWIWLSAEIYGGKTEHPHQTFSVTHP